MTAIAIKTSATNRSSDTAAQRITIPSVLQTSDAVAAYNFYTLNDSTPNPRNLVLGSQVNRVDAGGLQFGSGVNANAICSGLQLNGDFSFVISAVFGSGTGSIFGNRTDATTGIYTYTGASAIYLQVGDITGRATLNVTPSGAVEFAGSVSGTSLSLYTDTLTGTGADTSPRGTGVMRLGSQEASGITAANGMIISSLAFYSSVKTVAELRSLIALARAKRISDGVGV